MNKKLSDLIIGWRNSGSEPQEAFNWSVGLNRWVDKLPIHAHFLQDVLPSEIDRGKLRSICQDFRYDIIQKFLAVMVWGYGDRGYGPYRVSKMLAEVHATSVLQNAHALCRKGLPKEAYEYMALNRIKNLGPSFGTKFLSFCTPKEVGAPILDSYVGMWLKEFAPIDFEGVSLSYQNWNPKTYFRYWEWIKLHSEVFSCDPEDVELVIYRHAEKQFSTNSKWANK